MSRESRWRTLRYLRAEEGQALPWLVSLTALFLGMGGVTIDLGRAYVAYRQLLTSTDAAVLAGAYEMASSTATSTSVTTAATNFSSGSAGANASPNLPNVTVTTTLKCLSSVTASGIPCTASTTGDNALQVTQSVAMPTYFIQTLAFFGVKSAKSIGLQVTSTAAMRGAINAPYNVALLLDTTASMNTSDTDASCGSTRINCALQGVRTMLQLLSPCEPNTTGASCPSFDQVSLFTFPNIEADTAPQNKTCPGTPTVMNYSVPTAGGTWTATSFTSKNATYQLTPYANNYSSTYAAGGALSTSSQVTIDSGGKSGCSGMVAKGGVSTYYAAAIYAAQSSLVAAQASNPGSLNAMIILSDGDANSSDITGGSHNPSRNTNVIYGSLDNECQQAIAAAASATAAGTAVYTIAYGASSSGCSTDISGSQPGISPCSTLRQMASKAANFYSDATASQNKGQCTSAANPNLTLTNIFQHVAASFTYPRLISNNAT